MTLVTASTFSDALTKLTAQEQKQDKIAAYDLAVDPKSKGLSFHRVEAAAGFWTARIGQDLQIVLHKEGEHTLLAWGGHHDDADLATFLRDCIAAGIASPEIGVLVRGEGQLGRAREAARSAGLDPRDDSGVVIVVMHEAKGLEFMAVAVMGCDEDVLPDPARLAGLGDIADLEAAYETERHLLYVACTRARDRLLISGLTPGSEFLDDMTAVGGRADG